MKTTLIIARHGNTFGPGDIVRRQGGKTDLPLVESGLLQGRQIGAYLKQIGVLPDVIYSSHLQRTIQTAEQAKQEMGLNLPVKPDANFNEIDYGPDENKPEEEVVARLGKDAIEAWDKHCTLPDGWNADPEQIKQDWQKFADKVTEEHAGKTVLVVSSNGVIRFAPDLLVEKKNAEGKEIEPKVSTGSISIFTHEDGVWSCDVWGIKPKDFLPAS
ncbi:MAG TPA: histidine phosphatase family protein [Alphaproteobacteria bacterium]